MKRLRLNTLRARYWLSVGAQPSNTVSRIFERANILPPVPRKSVLPALPKDLMYRPSWLTEPEIVVKVDMPALPIVNTKSYESMMRMEGNTEAQYKSL